MEMEPVDDGDDIWWFICSVCSRAFIGDIRFKAHKRSAHNSSGVALMLSQAIDLDPRVIVTRDLRQRQRAESGDGRRRSNFMSSGHKSRRPTGPILKQNAQNSNFEPEMISIKCDPSTISFTPTESHSHQELRTIKEEFPLDLEPPAVDNHEHENDEMSTAFDLGNEAEGSDQHESESDDPAWEKEDDQSERKARVFQKTDKDQPDMIRRFSPQSEKSPYECKFCGRSHTCKTNLTLHIMRMHSVTPKKKCSMCDKICSSCSGLSRHMKKVHQLETVACDVCAKTFFSSRALYSHKQSHNSRTVMCPTCGGLFKSRSFLITHEKAVHAAPRFKCDICEKVFKRKVHLDNHYATHSAARPFSCPQCPKTYKSKPALSQHMSTHGKVYACRVCSKTFPGGISLRHHELGVHGFQRGPKVHQCDQCDKKFNLLANFKNHQLMHSNDRSHTCDECGKQFKSKSHLRQHKIGHLPYDQLPHVCDICGKRCGVPAALRSHMRRIHENGKVMGKMTSATTT